MMSTGSPSSSWVSARPWRPSRAAAASRSANHATTSGWGATAAASTSRGDVGLDQSVVTGTMTYLRLLTSAIVTRSGLGLRDGLSLRAVSYTHLRAHETVLDLVC